MKFSLKKKTIAFVVTIVAVVSIFTIVFSRNIISQVIQNLYTRLDVDMAKTVAATVDGDALMKLHDAVFDIYYQTDNRVRNDHSEDPGFEEYLAHFDSITEMEEYKSIRAQLQTLLAASSAESIYILAVDTVDEVNVYLADAAEGEDNCPPGSFDPMYDTDIQILDDPDAGFPTLVTNTEEYGWLIASGMPVYDSDHKIAGYVCADFSMEDIVNEQNKLFMNVTFAVLLIAAVICIFAIWLIDKMIVQPLNSLSEAAANYYGADNNAEKTKFSELKIRTGDEIQLLGESMAKMESDIEDHIARLFETTSELKDTREFAEEMDRIASHDALTGVRNKRAYEVEVNRLNTQIKEGHAVFGIAMIDLNDLKFLNDRFGHEKGDIALQTVCHMICDHFKHSPVFRYGGDEFVVLLEGNDLENADEIFEGFDESLRELRANEKLAPWERIGAAHGYAVYQKDTDSDVESVFKRADNFMYENKKQAKEKEKSE